MAERLTAKEVNADLNARTKARIEALKEQDIIPTLGIIRVGEKDSDLSYERGAIKRCETLGAAYKQYILPADASQEAVLDVIREANNDDAVHGILIFRPLPKTIDEKAVIAALDPEKDIDGITDGSMEGIYSGSDHGFPPCTAEAVIQILDHYDIDPDGMNAVVIGRSQVIGKPVSMMLLRKNATVTICHTHTRNMKEITKNADIVIAAAGKAGIVDASYLSEGQTVIDVGIHVTEEGKLCGDVDYGSAEPVVGAITPVPGGVGGVTTSVLISHVVEAAERMMRRNKNA
ncbi:MAG: bifunctional 5,10-methylenetetrahydrofolate dehydrogenase/5,10-methenyltetrahydrofolate cyclohydrolase [Eubacterium sp.]|nr:bifunctional 5,10-methylenetetrahydrofolate dehydrogenase/5,10-methenyltetrahydrofolate cyclohydrolase [Eubacterium sp.]